MFYTLLLIFSNSFKDLVQKNDIEQGLEEYIPIQLQCSQDDLV